jgi:hypothetical protein
MNCPACDAPNPPGAARCQECGAALAPTPHRAPEEAPPRPRLRRPAPDEDDEDDEVDDPLATVIPYRNGRALAAYYLGVFSLIPCLGLILGPLALIFGILGKRYVTQHPTAKGTGHAIAGIVLGSLTMLLNWGGLVAGLIIIIVGSATKR